jgi:hypothetical protein
MLVARVTRALPPLLSPNVPSYKSNGILRGRGKVTESGGIPGNSGVISFLAHAPYAIFCIVDCACGLAVRCETIDTIDIPPPLPPRRHWKNGGCDASVIAFVRVATNFEGMPPTPACPHPHFLVPALLPSANPVTVSGSPGRHIFFSIFPMLLSNPSGDIAVHGEQPAQRMHVTVDNTPHTFQLL